MNEVRAAIARAALALSDDGRCRVLAVTALLAHLALNFARGPGPLLEPSLAYEDGRDMFAFYYNERDPSSVLRFFAGYVSLVPNLIGFLTLALDGTLAALCLRIVPWLLNALALSLFVLPPWRSIVASDPTRFAMSLALALLPLQDFGMVTMTMYSLWSLLLIQCWLAALRAPPGNGALALSLGVQCGAAWSNPLSLLLLPLYGARLATARGAPRELLASALPVAATLVYLVAGVAPEPDPVDLGVGVQLGLALDYALQRVFFELVASSELRVALSQRGLEDVPRAVGLALLLAACGSALWLWRRGTLGTSARLLCVAALYVVPAATLLFVVARDPARELFLNGFGQRYFFLQKVALVLAAVCACSDVLARAGWRPRRSAQYALAVVGLVHLCALNVAERHLYKGLPDEFARTRVFLARLRDAERGGRHERVQLERGGEWTLRVIAR